MVSGSNPGGFLSVTYYALGLLLLLVELSHSIVNCDSWII